VFPLLHSYVMYTISVSVKDIVNVKIDVQIADL
jgi:hypothetical protein